MQADNGVLVNSDVTTTSGHTVFDGDDDNTAETGGTAHNKVGFTDGRTVSAQTVLTLESTTGSLEANGDLTLFAGSGIKLENSFGTRRLVKPLY